MGMTNLSGQYGGARAPSVSPSLGGASVMAGLGSAALGMLTGGGSAVIGAALESAKDAPTTQAPVSTNTQSTGSKVIGSTEFRGALAANPFWTDELSAGTSNIPLFLALGVFGLVAFWILKKA